MTISLRVDCPTCKGAGWTSAITIDGERDALRCRDCDGRGRTLAGWPWVKVPMSDRPTPEQVDKLVDALRFYACAEEPS